MFWPMRQASDQSPIDDREWRAVIARRWTRLHQTIADQVSRLEQERPASERADVEANLRLLKRAALSIWMDAQAADLDLGTDPPQTRRSDAGRTSANS